MWTDPKQSQRTGRHGKQPVVQVSPTHYYLRSGPCDLFPQLQAGAEAGQQVVPETAADVTVAEVLLHAGLVLHTLPDHGDDVTRYITAQRLVNWWVVNGDRWVASGERGGGGAYLTMNFHVFACSAMSRSEITWQISSRLWMTVITNRRKLNKKPLYRSRPSDGALGCNVRNMCTVYVCWVIDEEWMSCGLSVSISVCHGHLCFYVCTWS